MSEASQKIATALLEELSDRGQIVEGGWKAYELLTGLKDTPQVQRDECRKAFFFGAHHLFACLVGMLEPGKDETEQDLERMTKLSKELEQFVEANK